MLDLTKPLQLSDGTPVKYVKQGWDGRDTCHIVTIAPGYIVSVPRFTYSAEAPMSFRTSDLGHVCSDLTLQNVPTIKFDPTKPVQTRDGRPARILATDVKNNGGFIIVVAIPSKYNDNEVVYTVHDDGCYYKGNPTVADDLINVPEPRTYGDVLRNSGQGVNVTELDGKITKVELV